MSIKRVFLSHTSEFAKYPKGKSFIDASIDAVVRAEALPCDMEYFTARDQQPAKYCQERVRECDVYVGFIGLRYGSPVWDRQEVSYTELEFETACEDPPKHRLIFLLDEEAKVPAWFTKDLEYGQRQEQFRKRVCAAGVICKSFKDIHEFEKLLYQALRDHLDPLAIGTAARSITVDWLEGQSPYPGLEWFDEKYAPLFFGREREVADLLAKMSQPNGRLLIISGASGSGKSSLVAAGLWQALLKEGRLTGSTAWKWMRIQPSDGGTSWQALASGLKHAFPKIKGRPTDIAHQLSSQETTMIALLHDHLASGQEVVIFVDQLEEIFTQGFEEPDIQAFLNFLVTVANESESRVRVVATIRSEFIEQLVESEVVRQCINDGHYYFVGPVTPRVLQEMIERPAQATGYEFEPNLVETILDEAGKEPGSLPLVAYALKQLFEQRDGRMFTQAAYDKMKGVVGAIGINTDQVMEDLDKEVVDAFDRVFAELVHVERDRPPTRKRVPLARFQKDGEAIRLIHALAGQDCRVLVTTAEDDGQLVEVAHEKLFSGWKRLGNWISQSGEALRLLDRAEEEAIRWKERGERPEDLWLSPERIQETQQALKRFEKTPSPVLNPDSAVENGYGGGCAFTDTRLPGEWASADGG